jgi:hypothetical protein
MTRSAKLALLCLAGMAAASAAPVHRSAVFVPERTPDLSAPEQPPAPTFIGQAMMRSRSGTLVPMLHKPGRTSASPVSLPSTASGLGDHYLQDGAGSALAVNTWNSQNLMAGYNTGWDFNPDIPISTTTTGNDSWGSRIFPDGTGIFVGYPFDPWCIGGNAPGEFYSSLERSDLLPSDDTHTIISRSSDNGVTLTRYYEVNKSVFQDRAMMDIDRPATRGGTTGPHDGKIYLCYDDLGSGATGYQGSYLEFIDTAGNKLSEMQVSAVSGTTPPFRGGQFQPMAGTQDGQIYMVSIATASGGATIIARFHELLNGGAGPNSLNRSAISWPAAGQRLGTTSHWGVNGHRIDNHGMLVMDRTSSPQRGTLYFVSNRNPNPSDPTQDQGDIYLSVSVNGASSWTTARIPTATGRTQFFPMIDIDDQGWVHVAYYENGLGLENAGVLNAGSAGVYYTVSKDNGQSWSPPVQVNEMQNMLALEDPPTELAAFDYYLIGDYHQMRAIGTGSNTVAYILWTNYDKYRADDGVGTKKERVYATVAVGSAVPGNSPMQTGAMALALGLGGIAALGLRRRKTVEVRVEDR